MKRKESDDPGPDLHHGLPRTRQVIVSAAVTVATLAGVVLAIGLFMPMKASSVKYAFIAGFFLLLALSGLQVFTLLPERAFCRQSPIMFNLIAAALGFVFTTSLILCYLASAYLQFWLFLITLSIYHFSEFQFVLHCHFRELSADSFLINQSIEYGIAMGLGIVEYWIEMWLFNQKLWMIPLFVGTFLVFMGQFFRIGAFVSARSNFHHHIRYEKERGHKLVTTGVYAISRHPSYFGWFWWSIGTQVLLANPFCLVFYFVVSWIFFAKRIDQEERTLVYIFGKAYTEYKKKVGIYIPFISQRRIIMSSLGKGLNSDSDEDESNADD